MIKKAIALSAVLAAALAVTVSAGAVPCCFTNGSFESNNLNGWTPTISGGDAFTFAGGAPGGGSFAAAVETGNADVWQTLEQTSFGPAGWVRGWARFNNGDPDCFDRAEVLIDGNVVWSGGCGTGWVKFGSYVSSGGHTLTVRVVNGVDTMFDSTVDLDAVIRDVRFAPAP